MSKKKILLVFGTRPEAIKMAPLVKAFESEADTFDVRVCVTGQHREMLDQVLELFEIIPDIDLNIMHKGQNLYDVTNAVLNGVGQVIRDEHPDLVLVHGDTTTSMAAALASFYEQVPVGHVEAGLRTGNIYSPWPEEMNRQITGRIATLDFAPTKLSRENLIRENVNPENITVTGNTVIDALYQVVDKIKSNEGLRLKLTRNLLDSGYDVHRLESDRRRLVLITGHRRENFGDGFHEMCRAIAYLAQKYPDVDFVYPVHLNPNVRNTVNEELSVKYNSENLFLINPLDYFDFVFLMSKSCLVLTDSGGIQEEAPGLGKPVLVMRNTTERPEAVDAGTVKLVGTDFRKITEYVSVLLDDEVQYAQMAHAVNPYGDGKACGRIVQSVKEHLR